MLWGCSVSHLFLHCKNTVSPGCKDNRGGYVEGGRLLQGPVLTFGWVISLFYREVESEFGSSGTLLCSLALKQIFLLLMLGFFCCLIFSPHALWEQLFVWQNTSVGACPPLWKAVDHQCHHCSLLCHSLDPLGGFSQLLHVYDSSVTHFDHVDMLLVFIGLDCKKMGTLEKCEMFETTTSTE